MRRIILFIITFAVMCNLCICLAEEQAVIDLDCPSAILIERSTGKVLYEQEADAERPIASVTKIMTLLLIMEALENETITLETLITCSEHAVSMGGSQVYLKEGETMSVSDMLKAITVSSANDACVAMAEHIAGSVEAFVKMMNDRAAELGMKHTNFINCTGLDADGHYSSARDVSLMSAELLKYDIIREYTTIWMDSLRNGSFGLSNTNKLVRFYEGCTGLKTGSTSKALYCMSASAERDGMELIAVVLGASTSPKRFDDAKKLLNYGFASYELYQKEIDLPKNIQVIGGKEETAELSGTNFVSLLVKKGLSKNINIDIQMEESVTAPAPAQTQVGEVNIVAGEEILCNYPIVLAHNAEKATFWDTFLRIFRVFLTV